MKKWKVWLDAIFLKWIKWTDFAYLHLHISWVALQCSIQLLWLIIIEKVGRILLCQWVQSPDNMADLSDGLLKSVYVLHLQALATSGSYNICSVVLQMLKDLRHLRKHSRWTSGPFLSPCFWTGLDCGLSTPYIPKVSYLLLYFSFPPDWKYQRSALAYLKTCHGLNQLFLTPTAARAR